MSNMSTPTPAGGTQKPSTKRPPNWSWEDSKLLINSYKHIESTKMRIVISLLKY